MAAADEQLPCDAAAAWHMTHYSKSIDSWLVRTIS
jgi:hypothetical protein